MSNPDPSPENAAPDSDAGEQSAASRLLAELEAELTTVKFKLGVASNMGWYLNVEHWNDEVARLTQAIEADLQQRMASRQGWSVRTDLGDDALCTHDEVSDVVDLAMQDGANVITIERRKAASGAVERPEDSP